MTSLGRGMSQEPAPALLHVEPDELGIRRRRSGRAFRYETRNGAPVRDPGELARIRSLAIPPAWESVRIAEQADAYLQAVGRDARGRRQYRYHPDWRAFRDRVKFDHLVVFGAALPTVRDRVSSDLGRAGVPRDKVIATLIELLQTTLIRIGNDEYARQNHAYGLTTMRNRHVELGHGEIRFVFRGKSGQQHVVVARDRRVARILKRCQEIPGQRLFQYLDDDGSPVAVHSHDVNGYLRAAAGVDVTAKDFRTWVATVSAAAQLAVLPAPVTESDAHRGIQSVMTSVARDLGNTPAVCRASYVHPEVLDAFARGALADRWRLTSRARRLLTPDEVRLLAFLRDRHRSPRRRAVVLANSAAA
jgi:DNA topoisomerase-1